MHDLTNKKSSQNLYRWSLEALNRDVAPTGVLVTNGWVKNIYAGLRCNHSEPLRKSLSLKLLEAHVKLDVSRLLRKKEKNGGFKKKSLLFLFYTASQAVLPVDSQAVWQRHCFKGKGVYCVLHLSEASVRVGPVPDTWRLVCLYWHVQSPCTGSIMGWHVSVPKGFPSMHQGWGSSLNYLLVWVMGELFQECG